MKHIKTQGFTLIELLVGPIGPSVVVCRSGVSLTKKQRYMPLTRHCQAMPDLHFMSGFTRPIKAEGFTLIELLVVVLIIGILAAVAVPQYQKAVWKSRASNMLTFTRDLATAQQTYFMTNGVYATQFDELDLGFDNLEVETTSQFLPSLLASNDALRKTNNFELRINRGTGFHNTISFFTTGPYTGAGFIFNHTYTFVPSLEGRLLCHETNALISHPGDFCVKVMRCSSQKLHEGSTTSYYELPY